VPPERSWNALVRGVRRAQRIEEGATDPEQAAWRNQARISYDEDGTLVISVRLPAEQGAVVLAAVEQARAVGDAQHGPESSAEDSPPVAPVAEGPGWLMVSCCRLVRCWRWKRWPSGCGP